MHENDLNRVKFYSKDDLAGPHQLSKRQHILRETTQTSYSDINDIFELYNIKKYLDNELYLKCWSTVDIADFKQKAIEYAKVIGQFISRIDDNNVIECYERTLRCYVDTFWELVNNHSAFKKVSKANFQKILSNEPSAIHKILTHRKLVEFYDKEIKEFLLTYSKSAEILLAIYEVQDDFRKEKKFIPQTLTVEEKENIISRYLDSSDANFNFIGLIKNARNRSDFKISDKIRLKAKRLHVTETQKFFADNSGMKYGVTISFPEGSKKIKDCVTDDNLIFHYSYSLDFIKENNDPYLLFENFKYLFEFLDNQNRINLVNKEKQMGNFERLIGVHSQNSYRGGIVFSLSQIRSQGQLVGYNKVLGELNSSLENILLFVFTKAFQDKYNFAPNARFLIPSSTNSYFEKVRLLAPEFESILKQFKLFIEDGGIDFELLEISSLPTSIKDIPSLNKDKYVYFNEDNKEMFGCSNLFFSDQTLLAYIEPFKEKQYENFFELLLNEKVRFDDYEDYQKPEINYLIEKGSISVDNDGFIQIENPIRLLILKDLYDNEFASLYCYPIDFQKEARQMATEGIIHFDSSLFSKPEQAYFNYFLNKSEYTNGLDLRNSYLHGTQASPEEIQKHEFAYFTYLKLIVLAMLKMEDDLYISNALKNEP